MKLVDYIHLASNVKLYNTSGLSSNIFARTYKKSQVQQMIIDQIYDDLLSQVSKKEIKERVRNLIDKFEAIPPKKVIIRNIGIILKEMNLV